jgi:predicted outer membrane repeat protein
MACWQSSPTVSNCIFSDDSTDATGGGMACVGCSPDISGCTFTGNSAGEGGGGMYCDGAAPTVTNCTFSGNWGLGGGGMYCLLGAEPTVSNCTFSGNSARGGGGVLCHLSSFYPVYPTFDDCIFSDNSADEFGGGMWCDMASPIVSSCTFSGNSGEFGGGIACNEASPTVSECTFWGNSGSYGGAGMYCAISSRLSIENTIVAFSPEGSAVRCDDDGIVTLSCCDVYGNTGGDWVGCIADQYGINGNFSADPLFCDTLNGVFTLQDCSPCLPGYHPDDYDCSGIIGAYGSGCSCQSALEPTTWGGIKSRYR